MAAHTLVAVAVARHMPWRVGQWYKWDMTEEEAIAGPQESYLSCYHRDAYSGDQPSIRSTGKWLGENW